MATIAKAAITARVAIPERIVPMAITTKAATITIERTVPMATTVRTAIITIEGIAPEATTAKVATITIERTAPMAITVKAATITIERTVVAEAISLVATLIETIMVISTVRETNNRICRIDSE